MQLQRESERHLDRRDVITATATGRADQRPSDVPGATAAPLAASVDVGTATEV